MTMTATHDVFSLTCHSLESCLLRPLAEGEPEQLGRLCAGIDPYRRLGQSASALTAYLSRHDLALFRFGIETSSGLVGVVAVRSPWLRGPFLEMLAIMPGARGLGLGRQVTDWVATDAGRIAANLWTTVSDFNENARGFYRRLGFAEVSELPGLIAEGSSEILLRRQLPQ